MDFEKVLRQECTYYSDTDQDIGGGKGGSTAGYLISEEKFQNILKAHKASLASEREKIRRLQRSRFRIRRRY